MPCPRISIVTPSFNQVDFVRETLDSVLFQNYPDLEYIVIDGGSTDGSANVISAYEDRLSYFVSEPDSGHGDALNKGFAKTTGDIMAWLNSDDKYMPWTLRTVANIFLQHPDINWIVGTNGWWNDQGALVESRNVYKNIHDFMRGDFQWIQQESVFWRRSLWERAGAHINTNYKLMVDGELWTRFFALDELHHVHALLGGYRMHGTNRAQQYYHQCLSEMQEAIADMKKMDLTQALVRPNDYPILIYDKTSSCWRKHRGRMVQS